MPWAVPVATVIAAGMGTSAAVYSAKKQGAAQRRASQAQEVSNREALQFERENEERRRKEYDEAEAYNRAISEREIAREQARYETEWQEAMRRYEEETGQERERYQARETRLAPYRQAGTAALGDLARLSQQAAPGAPAIGAAPPLPEGMVRRGPPPPPLSVQVSPTAAGAAPPSPSYGQGAVNDPAGLALSMNGGDQSLANLTPADLRELQAVGFQVPMSAIARPRTARRTVNG